MRRIVHITLVLILFGVCGTGAALEKTDSETGKRPGPAWSLPAGTKTLDVNGYSMAYLESGSGPAVVLVHGSLGDYRYWAPQIASLSSRYSLIVSQT